MNSLMISGVAEDAVWTLLKMSLPLMLIALVIGIVVSLFQALTQIQEMTLSFVPKIIAVLFGMLATLSMTGAEITRFTTRSFEHIIAGGEGRSAAEMLEERNNQKDRSPLIEP